MIDNQYTVCVRCITFNHAPYIINTMDGFTMQKTKFPFVCTIVDDASTDGEQEVIEKYLEENFDLGASSVARREETDDYRLLFACHRENKNCFFAVLFLKYNHYRIRKNKMPYTVEWEERSKYYAFCEGDDFWVHPKKLQMQVDFMDNNPDYVLCHTDFSLSNGGYRNHNMYISSDDNYFPYSIHHELKIGTLTVLVRNEVLRKLPRLNVGKGWPMSDTPMWIELSHEGKIKYLPTDTARYRVLTDSASHGSVDKELRFIEAAREIHQFYADYYGIDYENEGFSKGYFISIMKSAYKHHCPDIAKKYFKVAKKKQMLSPKLEFFYFATCYKPIRALLSIFYKM